MSMKLSSKQAGKLYQKRMKQEDQFKKLEKEVVLLRDVYWQAFAGISLLFKVRGMRQIQEKKAA